MAVAAENEFCEYNLTEEEQIEASILSPLQVMNIKNKIAMYTRERIAIKFDPLNPILFAQQEAAIKGSLEVLNYLLAESQELTSLKEQLS